MPTLEVACDSVPVVCPHCQDLVSVDGALGDVSAGDPIRAFCGGCERNVEVAAPAGIDAFDGDADAVADTLTEFPAGPPQA